MPNIGYKVPGARPAVIAHEERGERSRNLLLLMGGVEMLGLAFTLRRKFFHAASAALGVAGEGLCFLAPGQKDSARAIVERMSTENPANGRYRALADSVR